MGNGRSIEKTCEQFGASQGTIARYLRVYELLPELRELLDMGKIPLRAGQELSWLGIEVRQIVFAVLTETGEKITEHQANQLREQADTLGESKIREILCGTTENGKPYRLSLPRNVITQYFPEKTKKYERCKSRPYPRHGFVCWNRDGSCLRTEIEAICEKKRMTRK